MNLTERAIVKNIIEYLGNDDTKISPVQAKFKLATVRDMLRILVKIEPEGEAGLGKVVEAITKEPLG